MEAKKVQDHCFGENFQHLYQQGKVLAVADIYAAGLSDCHVQILECFDIKANLVVPLFQEEKLWGLLCIHQCRTSRQWLPSEVEFTVRVGAQFSVALQHAEWIIDIQARSQQLQSELVIIQRQKEELNTVANQEKILTQIIDRISQTLDMQQMFTTSTGDVR